MITKYIVNNVSGQTIIGGLTVSGKTTVLSEPPTSIIGSNGDKLGDLAFDSDYLYYCSKDFQASGYTITTTGQTYSFNNNLSLGWNAYYNPPFRYSLQTGYINNGDESFSPQVGWYIVDDNYQIVQIESGYDSPDVVPNGSGYLMTMNGPFTISESKSSLNFYTDLPVVTFNEASGDIWKSVRLNDSLNVTGVYRALLSQTGPILGTTINEFGGSLIVGETYTFLSSKDDDFSNIANVISGEINQINCVFIATGSTPTKWINGSEIISNGNLVVSVLENTLGFDIQWLESNGVYIGIRNGIGYLYNNFNREKTYVNAKLNNFSISSITNNIYSIVSTNNYKDDSISLQVYDFINNTPQNNLLLYTPVEIKMNLDLDETPIVISGSLVTEFPISYASINLKCGENSVQLFYGDETTSNNMTELVNTLNTNNNTNFLGTYSESADGIVLTMAKNLANQFCFNQTLTFEVFED